MERFVDIVRRLVGEVELVVVSRVVVVPKHLDSRAAVATWDVWFHGGLETARLIYSCLQRDQVSGQS